MDLGLLGVYWYSREMPMKEYRDFLRDVLMLLRSTHQIFSKLQWVGDGKRKPIEVSNDLGNLDDIVCRHCWLDKKDIRGKWHTDGTPSWEAKSDFGFRMVFNTGKSPQEGGVTISVYSGYAGTIAPNCITISFPDPSCERFAYREFYSYQFLLNLFVNILQVTAPESGLVTSHEFSASIDGDDSFHIGWLTYFKDERCAQIAEEFRAEKLNLSGTLFSMGEDRMFVNSDETVRFGRLLRQALVQRGVIR